MRKSINIFRLFFAILLMLLIPSCSSNLVVEKMQEKPKELPPRSKGVSKIKGFPVTLLKPRAIVTPSKVNLTTKGDGEKTEIQFDVSFVYDQPDDFHRYTVNIDPALLNKIELDATFGSLGQLTQVNTVTSSQVPDFINFVGKFFTTAAPGLFPPSILGAFFDSEEGENIVGIIIDAGNKLCVTTTTINLPNGETETRNIPKINDDTCDEWKEIKVRIDNYINKPSDFVSKFYLVNEKEKGVFKSLRKELGSEYIASLKNLAPINFCIEDQEDNKTADQKDKKKEEDKDKENKKSKLSYCTKFDQLKASVDNKKYSNLAANNAKLISEIKQFDFNSFISADGLNLSSLEPSLKKLCGRGDSGETVSIEQAKTCWTSYKEQIDQNTSNTNNIAEAIKVVNTIIDLNSNQIRWRILVALENDTKRLEVERDSILASDECLIFKDDKCYKSPSEEDTELNNKLEKLNIKIAGNKRKIIKILGIKETYLRISKYNEYLDEVPKVVINTDKSTIEGKVDTEGLKTIKAEVAALEAAIQAKRNAIKPAAPSKKKAASAFYSTEKNVKVRYIPKRINIPKGKTEKELKAYIKSEKLDDPYLIFIEVDDCKNVGCEKKLLNNSAQAENQNNKEESNE